MSETPEERKARILADAAARRQRYLDEQAELARKQAEFDEAERQRKAARQAEQDRRRAAADKRHGKE